MFELLTVSLGCGQSPTEGVFLFSFQKIMKRLIKRYVLKAQVDRENDEVNEGKWNFIIAPPNEHVLFLLLIWPLGGLSLAKILCGEAACSCSHSGEQCWLWATLVPFTFQVVVFPWQSTHLTGSSPSPAHPCSSNSSSSTTSRVLPAPNLTLVST